MRILKPVFLLILAFLFCLSFAQTSLAEENGSPTTIKVEKSVSPVRMNLSGPRYGITMIPDGSKIAEDLQEEELDLTFSQFGWQFEYNASPSNGEVDFMVEIVGLLGGAEMGVVLPSLTSLIGVRTREGLEFGVGPNLSITGASLCVALGKAFDYGGIRIPVNLAFVKGPDGTRVSLITGFALKILDD